jgi:quaternary ammonium compound-resistance protein SugE
MAWFFLLLAGLLEVIWATGLKQAARETRYWPMILVFVISIGSFLCLARAMRELPLGTAYGIWTGIGAVGAAACGIWFYRESTDPWRLFFMALVVIGIVGLKVTARETDGQGDGKESAVVAGGDGSLP